MSTDAEVRGRLQALVASTFCLVDREHARTLLNAVEEQRGRAVAAEEALVEAKKVLHTLTSSIGPRYRGRPGEGRWVCELCDAVAEDTRDFGAIVLTHGPSCPLRRAREILQLDSTART